MSESLSDISPNIPTPQVGTLMWAGEKASQFIHNPKLKFYTAAVLGIARELVNPALVFAQPDISTSQGPNGAITEIYSKLNKEGSLVAPTGELPIVKGFEAPIRVVDELDGKELLIYNSQTRLREDPEIADNVLIELVDAGTIAEVTQPKDSNLESADPKNPYTTIQGAGYEWSSVNLLSGNEAGTSGFSANSAGGKLLLSPIPLESVPDDVRSQFQHAEEILIPTAPKVVDITEIFDTTNIGGGGESLEIKIMNLWGDETRQETRTVTNGGYKYINGVKTWIPAVTETIDVIATTHDVNTSPLKAWQRAVGIGYIEATNQIDETKIGDDGSFEMKNIAGLKPEGNIVINVSIIGDTTRILSRAGDVFIVTDIEIDEKNKESVKIGAVDWNALSALFDPDRVSEIVSNMTDLGGEDPDGLLAEIGGLNEMSKVFFPVEGGVFLPKVDVTLANDLLGLSGNDAMTAQSFGDVDYAYDPESGEITANFNQITFFATQEGNVWSWEEKEVPKPIGTIFCRKPEYCLGGSLTIDETAGKQMYEDFLNAIRIGDPNAKKLADLPSAPREGDLYDVKLPSQKFPGIINFPPVFSSIDLSSVELVVFSPDQWINDLGGVKTYVTEGLGVNNFMTISEATKQHVFAIKKNPKGNIVFVVGSAELPYSDKFKKYVLGETGDDHLSDGVIASAMVTELVNMFEHYDSSMPQSFGVPLMPNPNITNNFAPTSVDSVLNIFK